MLSAAIVVAVVGAGAIVGIVAANRLVHRGAERRVLSVAETVATMPEIAAALRDVDPTATLQPLAERVRQQANVSFVVVMTTDGIRFTHPNTALIGWEFVGNYAAAASGDIVVETFEGSLGPSVRAVVPVLPADGGPPVGLVSVGVTVGQVQDELSYVLPLILGGALLAITVASFSAWWISRRLARQTFGLGAAELARLYAHHDAVLHGVREGLIVVGPDRRVVLINDAALDLLGVGPEVQGRPVEELPMAGGMADLLASGSTVEDEVHLAGERLVVVSQMPVDASSARNAPSLGTVLTIRDHSDIKALADELSALRSMTDTLQASVHESANRLHTVVMLAQLGDVDAAVRLATGEVRATRALTSRLSGRFEDPALVALLLGKAAEAAQRSIDLIVTDDSRLPADSVAPVDLVTIVGNLIDNAMEAVVDSPAPHKVEVSIVPECDHLVVQVRDSGLGLSDEALAHLFEPGWSTKTAGPERRHARGIGMALVRQVATRLGGSVEVSNAPSAPPDGSGAGAGSGSGSGAHADGRSGPDGAAGPSGAAGAGETARDASGLGGAVVVVRLPQVPADVPVGSSTSLSAGTVDPPS